MAVGAAAEAVAEAWNRLTVTAATDAEALAAAGDCARPISTAGVSSLSIAVWHSLPLHMQPGCGR